jgi:hypothetical protein
MRLRNIRRPAGGRHEDDEQRAGRERGARKPGGLVEKTGCFLLIFFFVSLSLGKKKTITNWEEEEDHYRSGPGWSPYPRQS